jgi:hypothetical protein
VTGERKFETTTIVVGVTTKPTGERRSSEGYGDRRVKE